MLLHRGCDFQLLERPCIIQCLCTVLCFVHSVRVCVTALTQRPMNTCACVVMLSPPAPTTVAAGELLLTLIHEGEVNAMGVSRRRGGELQRMAGIAF